MNTTPRNKLATIAGVGIGTIALSVALIGCGSSTKSDEETSTTTETSETSAAETTSANADAPQPSDSHKTIQDYVKENDIQETPIKRGDPGGPTINLPVPDGWTATDELPEAPYGAIVYQGSAVPDNPPRILALVSKLTGNVDPAQILALAPNELQNIPGYDGPTEGQTDSLGGFEAVQLGGTFDRNGKKAMIAQKTVVIPAQDGLYVLQLNAYSDESESTILADATSVVDEQTTITP